jgi:hypothetical protein
LCTHAKSFYDTAGNLLNQTYGMRNYGHTPIDNEPPISSIGYRALEGLLSDADSKRILIDVKHMSLEARKAYYAFLEKKYGDKKLFPPVIWSHGAIDFEENAQINFSLQLDVQIIYETKGIIGLELDQRLLGYNKIVFGKNFKTFLHLKTKSKK